MSISLHSRLISKASDKNASGDAESVRSVAPVSIFLSNSVRHAETLEDTERAWHRRFATHRIETEWFLARPVVEVLLRSGVLVAVGDAVPS